MRSGGPTTVLEIETSQCVGCAICVDVCPEAAFAMELNDLRPLWLADRCTACAECVQECPTAAISLQRELAASVP
jgi:Na+-translocating ferredoxin:NAD+ oxidoreductase RNF subunit RnfB